MLDFTEQAPSTESPPELSPDTPTVSDSLQDTEVTAATITALQPYREALEAEGFWQDEQEGTLAE